MDRDWFNRRMDARGLTQERLADAVGLNRSRISRILSGERDLDLSEIEKWAEALGETPLEVLRHAYDWSRPLAEAAPGIDDDLLRFAINAAEAGLRRSADRDIYYTATVAESYVFLDRWRRRGRAIDERTLEQLEETIAARHPT
jgi:transcriptional regulator with XRE-family HTH domain